MWLQCELSRLELISLMRIFCFDCLFRLSHSDYCVDNIARPRDCLLRPNEQMAVWQYRLDCFSLSFHRDWDRMNWPIQLQQTGKDTNRKPGNIYSVFLALLDCECSNTGDDAGAKKNFGENSKRPDWLVTIPTDTVTHLSLYFLYLV